ncbi:tigger transposable element-derived protein 4-like [Belonocnema kinseyi]|uniref:tigger transposable element-derived protein 4-like n=1 Tax=Belonocnema kinseyi TaxID=2817044 RepID=UPI00143E0757|nr:tigger transposable element-derived protein 4-like [Belonocnema kinseyi]
MEKIKYTTLSLSEKLKLIRCVEKGVKRKKDIAADFKILVNSLTYIIKNKEKILAAVLEKGEFFAALLGNKDFKASSGWLEKFMNRSGITCRTLNGEIASVSEEDCKKFLTDILPSLLEVYAIEDIFNANETGKSKNPRCFKGVKSLPVLNESNKKAWMTSSVYDDWLHKIDHKFQRENPKVLLLVDNCPVHPKVLIQTSKAIKVVHLLPNLTAELQPMN